MKIEEIKTIVKLMSENDLTEFKIEAEEYNLCIKRGSRDIAVPAIAAANIQAPVLPQVQAAAPMVAQATPAPAAPAEAASAASRTINSPLVGTFYRAPSPDANPFVQVGDKVTADTTVAIIEAMKVLNEIKAETSGVIKEILVDNGDPVEYGQPIFVIE